MQYNPQFILKQLRQEQKMKYNGGIYQLTQIELAFNSNKIEGNLLSKEHTCSLFETKTILANKDD